MEMADVGFVEACEILSNGWLPELPHRLPKDWVRMAELRLPRKLSRSEMEGLDLAARVYHTMLVAGPKGPIPPMDTCWGAA
jgi:hypothetical protein